MDDTPTPTLSSLPPEIFDHIVERLVLAIGILKAVRLRQICKAFNTAILHAACDTQTIDLEDPALNGCLEVMNPRLRGMYIAAQSRLPDGNTKRHVAVVTKVCDTLESLIDKQDEEVLRLRRQAIAEAVNTKGWRWSASFDSTTVGAQNLLCGAVIVGDLSLLRSVREHQTSQSPAADINGRTPDFDQPLVLAAAGGHIEIVQYLLNNGAHHESPPKANPKAPDSPPLADYNKLDAHQRRWRVHSNRWNLTALRAAVVSGHKHIVRLLLQPEHRLLTSDFEYLRAIMAAASIGRVDLIQILFKAIESKVGDFKDLRYYMFWQAVRSDQREIAKGLLERGIKVNRFEDRCGAYRTTLEHAVKRGHLEMVRLLLERGADVNAGGIDRRYPVLKAAECGQEEIVDLLIAHGADPVQAFLGAAKGGQPRLLQRLLDKYPELPAKKEGEIGRQALQAALHTGLRSVTILVEAGAPLNDGYEEASKLPLNVAKQCCGSWVVDHLRSLGALETGEEPTFREHQHRVRSISVLERTWEWIGRY